MDIVSNCEYGYLLPDGTVIEVVSHADVSTMIRNKDSTKKDIIKLQQLIEKYQAVYEHYVATSNSLNKALKEFIIKFLGGIAVGGSTDYICGRITAVCPRFLESEQTGEGMPKNSRTKKWIDIMVNRMMRAKVNYDIQYIDYEGDKMGYDEEYLLGPIIEGEPR